LLDQLYEHQFEFIRRYFRDTGLIPITVLTHIDHLNKHTIAKSIALAKQATHSAEDNIFCVKNYTAEQDSIEEIDAHVLKILKSALHYAELFVQHEKVAARVRKYY